MQRSFSFKDYTQPLVFFPLILATGVTLFLFYIDEGYYSFEWMKEPGAWFVFSIYTFILFSIQLFLGGLIFKCLPNLLQGKLVWPSSMIINVIGIIIAIYICFILLS